MAETLNHTTLDPNSRETTVVKTIIRLDENGKPSPYFGAVAYGQTEQVAEEKARRMIEEMLEGNRRLSLPNPKLSLNSFRICNPNEIPASDVFTITMPDSEPIYISRTDKGSKG